MRAKKFKNALSLFMAFAVGLSCVSPVSFAEVEPTSKREFIERAKKIEQGSNTDQAYEKLQKAIKKAEEDFDAGKTDVELELTVDELNKAIEEFAKDANTLTPLEKVYKEFEAEIKRAESLQDDEDTFPGAKDILVEAIKIAKRDLSDYKHNIDSLKESFRQFKISVVEYEEGRYTSVKDIEKELQKKDPGIKIASILNVPVMFCNTDGSEFEWNSTLVTPARVYKTNKGHKMILALRRSTNPLKIGFLGRINILQGGTFVEATISEYSTVDSVNHPTEGTDVSMRDKKYPKEVVMDVDDNTKILPVKIYIPSSGFSGSSEEIKRIKFDWNNSKVEKVVTTKLEELIKEAKKIDKGKKTKSAFNELQGAINTAENEIKNIKTEEQLDRAITALNNAIDKFKNSADIKTDNLEKTIENAKNRLNADRIDEAKKELSDAIEVAEKVLDDFKSQDEVDKAEKALNEAIDKFEKSVKKSDKQIFESKIDEAETLRKDSKKVKEANDELEKAIDDAKKFLSEIVSKTNEELGVAISKIEKAIEDFEKKVKEEDWKKLRTLVNKANFILNNPDKYEQEGLLKLREVTSKALDVLKKDDFLQKDYDEAIKALEDALGKIKKIEEEKTYTVKAKLQAVGVSSPPMLDTSMNDVVKVIEKGSKARYELQFKPVKDGAKTVRVTEISAIENGNKQKADKFNNSSSEYNETFVISRNSTNEPKIPLEILTDDKDANGGNPQKFNLVFDWSTKNENPQNPQGNKVKLTLEGGNISSEPNAGEIEKNRNVKVTVKPDNDMKVKSFTVNGVERKSDLVNNVFNFRIEEDTAIKVEYEEKNPKPAEQKVKLTLLGENITSNPSESQIKKGTDVTVTVVPAANKEVSLFTVNGADKKSDLINNQYKFKINVDTEIKVEYKDKQTSSGGNSSGGGSGSSSSSRERDRDRDREIDRDRTSSRNTDRKSDNTVTIDEEEVAKSAPDINFIDVKNNHWAIDYIRFVVQRGIMVGVDKNRFDPNGKLSRAMLISMLARISKEKVEDAKQVEGIPQNQWYSKDMNWAVNAKIVQKNKDGKYDPIEALTRSEMATIIGRYLEYKGIKLEESNKEISFKDMNNMSEETMKYVNILAKYEIVVGDKTGKFNPEASLTRAETAVVMAKLVKAISK
ncbi:hypothetical protein HMPREF0379_1604 [[Eubacterium] yurii subsp. margaretiae ATCC 43715]|nr:hypothetical protein HMPREF0379_1604 [[Eubacterium] yurii subsp. margaretiae ATCC 43715]